MRDWNHGFSGTKVSYGMSVDEKGRVVRGEWIAHYERGQMVGDAEFRPAITVDGDDIGYDEYGQRRRVMGISAGLAVACAVIVIAGSLFAGLAW